MIKRYFIKSSEALPYYSKTVTGCEMYSNDRKLRIVASKVSILNNAPRYDITYFVRSGDYWERGNNGVRVDSLERYIEDLRRSPAFTNALREMESETAKVTNTSAAPNMIHV